MLLKKIRALENRTYVPYSTVAEEAKRLKMNGSVLGVDKNGDLSFSKNIVCANITPDNNLKIEQNKKDIANKADKDHTHSSFDTLTIGSSYFEGAAMTMNVVNRKGRIMAGRNGDQARLLMAVDQTNGTNGVIIARQSTPNFAGTVREAYLLDGNGNTSFPGTLTAANVKANNETRLKAVEEKVASSCYDDTELRNQIEVNKNKMDNGLAIRYLITSFSLNQSVYIVGSSGQITRLEDGTGQFYVGQSCEEVRLTLDGQPVPYTIISKEHQTNDEIERWVISGTFNTVGMYGNSSNPTLNFQTDDTSKDIAATYETFLYKAVNLEHNDRLITQSMLLDLLYPVGSIYTSMNWLSPSYILGGTWEQIVDSFLYCTNSSKETGGSKKIDVDQLPPHFHSYAGPYDMVGDPDGAADTNSDRYNYWRGNQMGRINSRTEAVGSGEDYMPPYMTVYAWYRTA